METFELRNEFIEINKLLKLLGWVQSGGQAKLIIQNNEVTRNGSVETRVRAKLVVGDVVALNEQQVIIAKADTPQDDTTA